MLPHRTKVYLSGNQDAFEPLSTENRRLYEQLLPHGSWGRGTQMPKGPLKLAVLDHYHFCFAYWAVAHFDEILSDNRYVLLLHLMDWTMFHSNPQGRLRKAMFSRVRPAATEPATGRYGMPTRRVWPRAR